MDWQYRREGKISKQYKTKWRINGGPTILTYRINLADDKLDSAVSIQV
jgi:hypothetical protein